MKYKFDFILTVLYQMSVQFVPSQKQKTSSIYLQLFVFYKEWSEIRGKIINIKEFNWKEMHCQCDWFFNGRIPCDGM